MTRQITGNYSKYAHTFPYRLDFETFSIEGPTSTSDVTGCVDSFISTVVSLLLTST